MNENIKNTVRSLDINEAKYTSDGVVDFYWPIDNKKTTEVMNSITSTLIPYLTENQGKHAELLTVRILFKWFLCEVLRLLEATIVATECKKDDITPVIPSHFKKLDAIYNSSSLECIFFLNQSSGPSYGRNIPRSFKRHGKEFLWNGLQGGLLRKYGSNANDVLAIGPSNLAIEHAKKTNKLLRYSDFGEWFGSMPKSLINKETNQMLGLQKILRTVEDSFSEAGYQTPPEVLKYISTWINHANNFVNYHLDQEDLFTGKIKSDVWFGCGGNTVWHVILIERLRRKGIKVVTHDHGSGNSYQAHTPSHWVEYMHTDHFVTFNAINEKNRNSHYNSDLMMGQPDPLIQCLDSILGNKHLKVNSKTVRASKKIKKIMYVSTAFVSEGARLFPIFHDIPYFDWQIKLLSHLKELNIDVIYKPHPEGATTTPLGFAESFGFQSNIKRFEEINEDVDAYIIDFIFSSTTPSVLKTDKPVFFINFGFPELIPEALNLVKKRCYYIDGKHSTDSRLSIDFNEFDQFINNEEHIFDTSFSDVYFNNA